MIIRNLPRSRTPFIGRVVDLAQIKGRLSEPMCKLLTIVGPGGIGKSRLAIEVATRSSGDFADGVYFVPLQALGKVDDIIPAILDALPLRNAEEAKADTFLFKYLSDKNLLLVLDNFEHLLEGINIILDMLAIAPKVKLIVTSRQRLNVSAEYTWPLQGLTLNVDHTEPSAVSDACQLFAMCAQRVHPRFSLLDDLEFVKQICDLVEGMPLAIELAASWTHVMPCKTIATELKKNIDEMLVSRYQDFPERHQSISVVIDHSWRLLNDSERYALRRLSVFTGGFTQHAAQEVAKASLELLASLVDKSFIQVDENGRYDLHEVVRQFALHILKENGELKDALDSHGSYFVDFVLSRIPDMKSMRQIPANKEFDREFENIKAAWNWGTANEYEQALDNMLDGIHLFASLQYRHLEARALYANTIAELENKADYHQGRLWRRLTIRAAHEEEIISKIEWVQDLAQQEHDLYEVAYCLELRGSVAYLFRQYDKAIALWDKSIELYRQLGDIYALANALTTRMIGEQRWDYIKNFRDEILQLRRSIGDRMGIAGLPIIAFSAVREGRFAESEALWLEKMAIGHDIGNIAWVVSGYSHLSYSVYFFSGDFVSARENATKAIEIAKSITHTVWVTYWAKATLGLLETMNENYEEATRLFEEATKRGLHRDIQNLSAWGLTLVSCGLSKFDAARKSLVETYHLYLKTLLGQVGQLSSLPIISLMIADQGQTIQAVELLALAMSHPIGASGWMQKWPVLQRSQQEWQNLLGADAYTAAWNRGQQLELDDVMYEVETRFLSRSSFEIDSNNSRLNEPLSPRELEVLGLIAEGLINREIAERLFIGVSTVKKHIQHIYAKLDTKNRTSAVLRARELKIISQ